MAFLEHRLPSERAREESIETASTELQKRAMNGPDWLQEDFRRMENLRYILEDEKDVWKERLSKIDEAGGPHNNKTYSGFPLSRHYQEAPSNEKPEPPNHEGLEAYPSIPLAILTRAYKPKFKQKA